MSNITEMNNSAAFEKAFCALELFFNSVFMGDYDFFEDCLADDAELYSATSGTLYKGKKDVWEHMCEIAFRQSVDPYDAVPAVITGIKTQCAECPLEVGQHVLAQWFPPLGKIYTLASVEADSEGKVRKITSYFAENFDYELRPREGWRGHMPRMQVEERHFDGNHNLLSVTYTYGNGDPVDMDAIRLREHFDKSVKSVMQTTFSMPARIKAVADEFRSEAKKALTGELYEGKLFNYAVTLITVSKLMKHDPDFRYWSSADDIYQLPGDARVEFMYMPTYIATCVLMKAYLNGDEEQKELLEKPLRQAMHASLGRALDGHGLEAQQGQDEAVELFRDFGAIEFLGEYPDINPEFTEQFRTAMRHYAGRQIAHRGLKYQVRLKTGECIWVDREHRERLRKMGLLG